MPYVLRSPEHKIIALLKTAPTAGAEYVSANDPEVLAFIENAGRETDVHLVLQDSDADIARVTEDLIYLLVKKNAILFTELPEAVQAKLIAREKLRTQLTQGDQSPVSEDDTI